MNILFCGDHHAEDGILIATLSLLAHVKADLHIYILTMTVANEHQNFQPFSKRAFKVIQKQVTQQKPNNHVDLIDCTTNFNRDPPTANMGTFFTPYALLRLYADLLPQIPDRILYLDDDVIVRQDLDDFYRQDLTDTQLVGVLDFYGRFFYHHQLKWFDYINSGVLLLNLSEIRRTHLFDQVRKQMAHQKMMLPDQAALNQLAKAKRIAPRRYNEQHRLQQDTVIQHFSTQFRFLPFFRTLTVKPWQCERMHHVLKLTEYDDLLAQYQRLRPFLRG